ncbi:two-component response regulator ARR2-like isoform X3 [Tripterygium wilfordii]|uniref:two-component response regulator ARR2-like isoform X3 n=1 Tax=Tripterygium wilfordii TaxID=458696 RepID=UPI0018F83534|nr:two-component response regulator ARR2-like isoform X3 [Tripterygium wilfordii]
MCNRYMSRITIAYRAVDALRIVWETENELDLILMEAHLPDMQMNPLLTRLEQMSNLPIVIMSADNDSNTILGSYSKGAVFYLVKPLTMNDVKNLWQFAYISKTDKMMAMEEVSGFSAESHNGDADDVECIVGMEKQGLLYDRINEEETLDKEDIEDGVEVLTTSKILWTDELHEKFLKAVKEIGIENAHPKSIFEHMNVQGLKKEHVSSHLQKYRIALKKEQESIQNIMRKYPIMAGFAPYSPSSTCDLQGPDGVPNFMHGQSTLVNCLPDSSHPNSSQFGFRNLVMGELPSSNQMENNNFEEFLKGRTALSNVEGSGLSAAPWPNFLNNPLTRQEQFLMPQQSSLPPLQPQGQEAVAGNRGG